MNPFKKLYNFITKDTGGKNESVRLVFVVRLICVLFILYAIFLSCMDVILLGSKGHWFFALFFVAFGIILGMSYRIQFNKAVWILNVTILLYIAGGVWFFGWSSGIQQMISILLMLCFFSSYKHYLFKGCYAIFLLLFRLALYFGPGRSPATFESGAFNDILQIVSFSAEILALSIVAFVFSKESQKTEGKLLEYNVQLETQANTDPLTGLFNRRKAMEFLNREMDDIDTNGLCLCICDIDFFKKVNDNYGHDVGDEVLRTLSRTMQNTFRDTGCVISRWGGEEFLIIFPDCNGDDAKVRLSDLRAEVSKLKFEILDRSFGISLTYGLAEYDFRSTADEFVREADRKLYFGKENGRNQIVF